MHPKTATLVGERSQERIYAHRPPATQRNPSPPKTSYMRRGTGVWSSRSPFSVFSAVGPLSTISFVSFLLAVTFHRAALSLGMKCLLLSALSALAAVVVATPLPLLALAAEPDAATVLAARTTKAGTYSG